MEKIQVRTSVAIVVVVICACLSAGAIIFLGASISQNGQVKQAGVSAPVVLFAEQSTTTSGTNVQVVSGVNTAASGVQALKMSMPNSWHLNSTYNHAVVDLKDTNFDKLQFKIRTVDANYAGSLKLSLYYSSTANKSMIDLKPYLNNGMVTQQYQLVSIPREDFFTKNLNTSSTFPGTFRHFRLDVAADDVAASGVSFYIDDITVTVKESGASSGTGSGSAVICPINQNSDIKISSDVKKVYFDENVSSAGADVEVINDSSLAYSGSKALKLSWFNDASRPTINVSGPNLSFSAVSADSLEFYLRTVSGTYDGPLTLKIRYSVDSDGSQVIDLKGLNGNCPITEKYQRIVVPLSAMGASFKGNFRQFILGISPDQAKIGQSLLIDGINIDQRRGEILEKVEVLDYKHLMLTFDKKLDSTSAKNISSYSLASANGQSVGISAVSFRTWVEGFAKSGSNPNGSASSPIIKYYVYLTLSSPLSSSVQYNLKTTAKTFNGALPEKGDLSFSYNFDNDISSSIKINQVGYLPDSPKIAYVGNYLGDGGEMSITPGLTGYLKNSSGQNSFSAPLVKSPGVDAVSGQGIFTGEEVWTFDFSKFQPSSSGQYYVFVPGIGRSYTFTIGDSVYNDVFYKSARSLMYQRSDINLDSTAAGIWARQPEPVNASDGKPRTGYIHNSVAEMSPLMWSSSTEAVGSYRDLSGGWYDAADYSHYVPNGFKSVNYLLTMFEISPANFKDGQLNLPNNESRNGVPDYLDNVKWEVDWLAKMVPENGCVSTVLGYDHWPQTMPAQETGKMWAITRNTESTAGTAGALAQAARIMKPYFPKEAASYEAKAFKAYSCLERFPTQYPVIATSSIEGKYCNPTGSASLGTPDMGGIGCAFTYGYQAEADKEARIMAAIEMFRLTGDSKYHNTFKTLLPIANVEGWVKTNYYLNSIDPVRAYSYYMDSRADATYKAKIKTGLLAVAKAYDKDNRWRYSLPEHSISNTGFGSFTTMTYSYNYLLTYLVTGDSQYLTKAKGAMNAALGANPLSKSFMTGVGSNSAQLPISNISDFDNVPAPVPGYIVYGPGNNLKYKGFYAAIIDYAWPLFRASSTNTSLPTYPAARRYVDSNDTTYFGEYTIMDLSVEAAVFGYFSKF